MDKAKTNVPVMLLFFNRPQPLKRVFEAVREAKPKQLFLVQDGPRANRESDVENIQACRRIVENIDWECEVYKDYSEENLGCGLRTYSGMTNCFKVVDRVLMIEDDTLPSQQFFRFCEELLERYKDDERINHISAFNHLGKNEFTTNSYFFTCVGGTWCVATWKRVWEKMEFSMDYLHDPEAVRCIRSIKFPRNHGKKILDISRKRYDVLKSGGRISAWTGQFGFERWLNSRLILTPTVNMMTNIGLTADSAHAVSDKKYLTRREQELFDSKIYSCNFPLQHPKYIIADNDYADKVQKRYMNPSALVKAWLIMEKRIRRLIFR